MYKRVKDDFQLRIVLIYGLCAAILLSAFATYRFLSGSIAGGLLDLPAGIFLFPGHGPPSTLEVEKRFNPYLGDEPSRLRQ